MFVVITVIGLHRSRGRSVPWRLSVTRAEPGASHSRPGKRRHSGVSDGSRPCVAEGQDVLCSPAPMNVPQMRQAGVTRLLASRPLHCSVGSL